MLSDPMIFTEMLPLEDFHSWLTILGFCNTQADGIDACCYKTQHTCFGTYLQLQIVNIPCVPFPYCLTSM